MIKEPRFIASELLLFGFGSDEEFEVHRNPPSFLCLFFIFFYILSLFGFETFAVPPLFVNIFLFWGFFSALQTVTHLSFFTSVTFSLIHSPIVNRS